MSSGLRLIYWVFGQICQYSKVRDAPRRGKLLAQLDQVRFIHGANRETDVSLIVFKRQGRATLPAKPTTHLVRTPKITGLASGPRHCSEGRSDVGSEQPARCLLAHSTMADGAVFQFALDPEPHRSALTASGTVRHDRSVSYQRDIRNSAGAERSLSGGRAGVDSRHCEAAAFHKRSEIWQSQNIDMKDAEWIRDLFSMMTVNVCCGDIL